MNSVKTIDIYYSLSTFDCSGININNVGFQPSIKEHSFGPYVRAEYVLQYVVSGEGTLKTENATYRLKKGDMFLLEKNKMSFYYANEKDPYTYYWVGFNGVNAEKLLSIIGFSDTQVISAPDEEVLQLMRSLNANATAKTKKAALFAMSDLYRLFAVLCKSSSYDSPPSSDAELYVSAAIKLIDERYFEPLKISDVAKKVGLDRTYFSALFKKYVGSSPLDYLLSKRIASSCDMLRRGSSVTETALACGFSDVSNFSVRFKKFIGYSPKAFKTLYQNK